MDHRRSAADARVDGTDDRGFAPHREKDCFVLSFSKPARVLSWAILNGGFRNARHLVNHHVKKADRVAFIANPRGWLLGRTTCLKLKGAVVGMATAVEMRFLAQSGFGEGRLQVSCFATVGLGNALAAGDRASFIDDAPHTINLVAVVEAGLSEEAMVEAVQIVTEGRVRALHEAGIRSSVSSLAATGTGTDCIAVVSLGPEREPYCGKHTQLGEWIGLAAYSAVKEGLAQATSENSAAQGGDR